MSNLIFICKICNHSFETAKSFSVHLKSHKIKSKDYYDQYLKTNIDGFCKICGKPTSFKSITVGYKKYCSNTCINKDPEIREKIKNTSIENYGVEFPAQSNIVKEKIKKRFKEKYNVEYYSQTEEYKEKYKNTCIFRYGVESVFQSEIIKNKSKETCKEKYGSEYASQSEIIKNKIRKTNKEKYGVEYITQNQEIQKHIQESCKNTLNKRYGVNYTFEIPYVKEKIHTTIREKYGIDNISQLDEIKNKIKETNIKKYGYKNPAQVPEIQQKIRKTNKERYGVEFLAQNIEIKEKQNQTNAKNKLDYYKNFYNNYTKIISMRHNMFHCQCNICKQEYDIQIQLLKYRKIHKMEPCIFCNPIYKHFSYKEKEFLNFIKNIYDGIILENVYKILNNKLELDIYLPELKLAFEFDGTYWHADPRFYNSNDFVIDKPVYTIWEKDRNKEELCKSRGIKLIRILEYDWDNLREAKEHEILNIINNLKE